MDIRLTIIILTKYVENYMTSRPYNLRNGRIYNLHLEITPRTDITDISVNKNSILKKNIFIHYQKRKYKIRSKSDYNFLYKRKKDTPTKLRHRSFVRE